MAGTVLFLLLRNIVPIIVSSFNLLNIILYCITIISNENTIHNKHKVINNSIISSRSYDPPISNAFSYTDISITYNNISIHQPFLIKTFTFIYIIYIVTKSLLMMPFCCCRVFVYWYVLCILLLKLRDGIRFVTTAVNIPFTGYCLDHILGWTTVSLPGGTPTPSICGNTFICLATLFLFIIFIVVSINPCSQSTGTFLCHVVPQIPLY